MTTIQNPEITQNKNIIICIPAFNEEESIGDVITKAKKFSTEILVYDDGSTDNTSEIAQKNGAFVIRNRRNGGYGRALNILFQHAIRKNADIIITLDSDGQHDASQIPRLIEPIVRNEADIVIGSRFLTKDDKEKIPKYRSFGIKAITKVTQIACYDRITDATSGFRAYNFDAISKLHLSENGMAVSTEILLKANQFNLRMIEVPITTTGYDIKDSSTHHPIRLGLNVISHVIQFLSFKRPLLFYGLPGLVLLITSAFFMYIALDLFSSTRYVSTNLIIISIGFSLLGIVLLATSAIIYTIVTLNKGKFKEI